MASGCCRRLWVAYRWGCQLPVASCLSVGRRESPVGSCLMPALVLVRHYLTQLNWTLVAKLSWQLPLVCLCVSRLQCIAAKCLPLPQQLASDPPHTSHHSSLSLFLQLSHIALPALRWFRCAKFVANHLTVYKVETLSCTSDCVPTPMPMPPIMPIYVHTQAHAHALRVYPRYVVVLFTQLLTAWRCHDYKYATDVTADVVS